MTNTIISAIIILILISFNIYISKKNKYIFKKDLYNKVKKIKRLFYTASIFLFILFLIINLLPLGSNPTTSQVFTSIINALSITILSTPISLDTLYLRFFNDEEKYSHIKTIITNIYDKNTINKFIKADINVILLSEEKTNLKTINEDKVSPSSLLESIQIKTSNLKIIDKKINKETTIKEYKDLKALYTKIEQSRSIHDNYIRTIKYLVLTYLPIIISYFLLLILKFPIIYNILLVSILKLYTTIKSDYLYKNLPYDNDIMNRKVKPANIIMGKQETILLLMECFTISFLLTLLYMYVLANSGTQRFANTMYIVSFIMINTFLTYYQLNDSSFIKNIFKYIKCIRLHIFTILSVILILIFNYTSYFSTKNIGLQNNIGCLIVCSVTILIIETTKLARYTTMKGKEKNEIKNNKKSRRS